MSKGMQPYGSRQSLKNDRSIAARPTRIRNMRRTYVLWWFSGRKEAVKASKERQIRQVGTKGCDWLQPAEKHGAQGYAAVRTDSRRDDR